ncbi:MAG: beta-galactosidase [Planctomycetes bacterium]|nr:beta-galactosidase [Planctomycetota bacterium]
MTYQDVLLPSSECKRLLRVGENVIAAHCRQTAGGQFLDIRLIPYGKGALRATSASEVPRPEHPRPDWRRKDWLNLNGTWEFAVDREGKGRDIGYPWGVELPGRIRVPYPPESRLSGIGETDFLRHVWYRKTVRVPEPWLARRVLLHFGAVDYAATVWVNGLEVGAHTGGYSPFAFDITDALVEGWADIVVLADDPDKGPRQARGKQSERRESYGCIYTRTTGIWQTVYLESVPGIRVESARILPAPGAFRLEARFTGSTEGLVFEAIASAGGKKAGEVRAPAREAVAGILLPLAEPRLWSPEDPFLYEIAITLRRGDEVIDRVESYAGLRTIAIDGPRVLINGKSIFQRLVLDQGFYPEGIYTAPADADLRRDIEISKELGFNGARLHMKVFEPRFIHWADRLGYLVWGEFPNWGLDHGDPGAIATLLSEWLEVLDRDINHPAIIGWCPFNETPGDQWPAGIRTVYRVTKAIDPSRPVIDTSGYIHVETDINDCHNYDQDPESLKRAFEPFARGEAPWHSNALDAPHRGQPFMVSEFGGTWWAPGQPGWGYGNAPKTEEEFLKRFRGLVEALLFHPKMFGFCYTQLYDIEQEVNGLATYDRKPKFDPAKIRAILSQPAAIEK